MVIRDEVEVFFLLLSSFENKSLLSCIDMKHNKTNKAKQLEQSSNPSKEWSPLASKSKNSLTSSWKAAPTKKKRQ